MELIKRINETLSKAFASAFVRQVIQTFSTRILLMVLGLATTVFVTRALGPEGRGLYAVAVAIGAIGVQFGNLGLHASNTYYVAQDRSRLPALLGNSMVISLLLGGFGVSIAWCLFYIWPDLAPVTGNLLIMALIGVPIGLAYLLVQNLLIGIQDIKSYNLIEIFNKILSVILIAFVIVMNSVTVENIFAAGLTALTFGLVLAIFKLKNHLNNFPKPSVGLFKVGLRFGFKAYLAAFFSFIVLKVDLLMVQFMLGAEQAGYYSIAVSLADMVYMLPVIVGTILFPKLSALDDPVHKWVIARKAAYFVLISMTIIIVISALLSETIVKLLFGVNFLPSVTPFVWLMPGILLLSVNTIFMNYFASMNMPSITVYSSGFACLLNIYLNYQIIPSFGIIGASLSSFFSYGMMLLFSLVYQYLRRTHFAI